MGFGNVSRKDLSGPQEFEMLKNWEITTKRFLTILLQGILRLLVWKDDIKKIFEIVKMAGLI